MNRKRIYEKFDTLDAAVDFAKENSVREKMNLLKSEEPWLYVIESYGKFYVEEECFVRSHEKMHGAFCNGKKER